VRAVVTRSTFLSQNIQNATCSRHFWRFGCWKSARRCGAKHISKSKCTKHLMFAPLVEVRMLKECAPLWSETHFQVKIFWRFGCRFASLRVIILHYTLHYTTIHYTTLHSTTPQLQLQNYTTTLHYTPLHSTTLHYIKLQYTTPHYTTLLYTTLHYITLHYTTL